MPMIALNISEGNSTDQTLSGPSEPGLDITLKEKVNGLRERLAF